MFRLPDSIVLDSRRENIIADKIDIQLGNVQKTLLLPLWGRAVETRKKKPRLVDETAVKIIESIDYDFSTIAQNINEISRYAWIARSLHIDRTIGRFLMRHPKAAIVNIGCGLDTTFERTDNGALYWYDLDLPDVISLRRKFLCESERRKFIARSFLDDSWFQEIATKDNLLCIAAGVFYYFEEEQMKNFFIGVACAFPGSEILFDAASPFGVKVANQKVIKAGGMDESSILRWGIDKIERIRSWDDRIQIIEEYPMFKGMKKGLGIRKMIGTMLFDHYRIMSMVHCKV